LGRVGHLGGDDFVVIFQSDDWKLECEQILKVLKSNFITISMIKIPAQGIYSFDKRSKAEFFPLMGLPIGVVNSDAGLCNSHHDVSQVATEAKLIAGVQCTLCFKASMSE